MISRAQVAANRRNAQRSTGPKTLVGKVRSSRNARTHGLAIPVAALPTLQDEIEALARVLAGSREADPLLLLAAREVAEAELDLRRVRSVKRELIDGTIMGQHRHLSEEHDGKRHTSPFTARESVLAQALAVTAEELLRLDRYERRALSRRRTASQRLTAALFQRNIEGLSDAPFVPAGAAACSAASPP